MARHRKRDKREKTIIIKLETDKNLFNLLLKPRFSIVKSPMIEELVRESSMQKSIEPQIKQLMALKQLLNPEKIKIIYTIKHYSPKSIYELSKKLKRDFKAVSNDLKILEQSGFIKIEKEKIKNRWHSKPILQVDKINFTIEI
jgi:predicted transcriptional regulator